MKATAQRRTRCSIVITELTPIARGSEANHEEQQHSGWQFHEEHCLSAQMALLPFGIRERRDGASVTDENGAVNCWHGAHERCCSEISSQEHVDMTVAGLAKKHANMVHRQKKIHSTLFQTRKEPDDATCAANFKGGSEICTVHRASYGLHRIEVYQKAPKEPMQQDSQVHGNDSEVNSADAHDIAHANIPELAAC